MLVNVVDSIVGLQSGSRAITFESFYPWFVLSGIIFLISSVAILSYYKYKGYSWAFTAGLISTVAMALQYAMVYNLLTYRFLQKYYVYTAVTALTTGLLYGVALAFTNASERPWLKRGGIWSVICTSIMLVTFVLVYNTTDIEQRLLIEKIHRLTALAGVLVPLAFLLNFVSESEVLPAKDENAQPVFWRELLKLTAVLGVLLFGIFFFNESMGSRPNKPFVPDAGVIKLSNAFPARNYVNSKGETLPYRLALPLNYDSTKQYPMIVCLHHGGTHGKDNVRQLSADPAPFLLSDENRRKYPAFVFMPHCPEGAGFGGAPGYPTVDSLVFDAIRVLQKQYSVDTKRLYVMGISGGGYGSWHFISKHPEMFAAAIPICGAGDPKFGKTLVNMPIWAFHGSKDRLAPVSGTRDVIDAIEKAGGKPIYTEFKGEGHDIWRFVKEEPKLMDWLFAQNKN
jgi:hypothetical protein